MDYVGSLAWLIFPVLIGACPLFWSRESGFRCAILKLFRRNKETAIPQEELVARFEIRDRFLGEEELQLYRRLCAATSDRAIVCPKPKLLEILRVLDAAENLEDSIRVDRKHVDFLICSESTGHPLCAVQIDWWDHQQESFQPRPRILDLAFQRASFPALYVPSNQMPSIEWLREQLSEFIGSDRSHPQTRIDRASESVAGSNQICATDGQKV